MFNHNSFNLFKRYFILKYNINPDNINKNYNQPFLGLIMKDNNYLLSDVENIYEKKDEIIYGLPYEILFNSGREFITNEFTYSITNEFCKLEEYNKLIPLPKIGTLLNDSLRSLYFIQNSNRILPKSFKFPITMSSVTGSSNTVTGPLNSIGPTGTTGSGPTSTVVPGTGTNTSTNTTNSKDIVSKDINSSINEDTGTKEDDVGTEGDTKGVGEDGGAVGASTVTDVTETENIENIENTMGILNNVIFNDNQIDLQSDLNLKSQKLDEDENRIEDDIIYILSYGISNNNQLNCCTLSSFDGRFISIGQNNGIILLYDLLTSECNNVYNDISCIIGSGIAYKSVTSMNPGFTKSLSNPLTTPSYEYGDMIPEYEQMEYQEEENTNIIYAHDGCVNCIKFGENGQILLSAGNDGLIKLFTTNNNSCKSIYYNSSNTVLAPTDSITMGKGTTGTNSSNSTKDTNTKGTSFGSVGSMTKHRNGHRNGKINSVLNIDYGNYGYYFSSCDINGYCKIWCTDRSYSLRNYKPINNLFYYNKFHPNSSLISLLSYHDIFTLYDLKSNKLTLQFCYNSNEFNDFSNTVLGHTSTIHPNSTTNPLTNSTTTGTIGASTVTMGKGANFTAMECTKGLGTGTRRIYGTLGYERNRIEWSKNGIIYGICKENILLLYDIRNGKLLEKIVHDSNILGFDFSYSSNIISIIDQYNISFWSFNNMNKYILNDTNADEEIKLKKNLIKAYKYKDLILVHNAFTPENVLLTLGISTL
uniref:WD domain, G-beta repeat, putative n=1 Tax=Theileria annulata TaxID=5874 RepID=A0A3B0MWH8_THEAN